MAFVRTVNRYSAFLYPNDGKQVGRINLYCNPDKLYILFRDPSDSQSNNSYNESSNITYIQHPKYRDFLNFPVMFSKPQLSGAIITQPQFL